MRINYKKFFTSILLLAMFTLAVVGGYSLAMWTITGQPPNIFASIPKKTYLIMGTDDDETRSDVMMLVMTNPSNKTINVVSIPRDTRVKYKNKTHKINTLLGLGKDSLSVSTVSDITNQKINGYARLNFAGFRNVIDILGGVDYDVPMNMYYCDPTQDLYINLKKGQQHLDGKKAEQLVRYRGYANGDLARINIQQDFIKTLVAQKLNADIIKKAPELTSQAIKYLKTNISLGDMLRFAKAADNLKEYTINTYQLPGQAEYIDGISYFLADSQKINELFKEIATSK